MVPFVERYLKRYMDLNIAFFIEIELICICPYILKRKCAVFVGQSRFRDILVRNGYADPRDGCLSASNIYEPGYGSMLGR